MKDFIDKLISRLEEEIVNLTFDESIKTKNYAYKNAIEIVNKLTEEYNNGWIPCSGCKDCQHKECEHYGKV